MIRPIGKTGCVDNFNSCWKNLALVCVGLGVLCSHSLLQAAPNTQKANVAQTISSSDEILLLSTRSIGTVCESETLKNGLLCQRCTPSPSGKLQWINLDWRSILSSQDNYLTTVFYVHGNRVARGEDRYRGMKGLPFAPKTSENW